MNKRGAGGVEETLQQSFLSKGLKSEEEDTTTNLTSLTLKTVK